MPYICPVCNAMQTDRPYCPECLQQMEDEGRLMDFFGDYSPYLDIDGMKMADGVSDDFSGHQCPHLFVCASCGHHVQRLVDEIYLP